MLYVVSGSCFFHSRLPANATPIVANIRPADAYDCGSLIFLWLYNILLYKSTCLYISYINLYVFTIHIRSSIHGLFGGSLVNSFIEI